MQNEPNLKIDSDDRNYNFNNRLQQSGHLVSWEKRTQNEPNLNI